MDKFGTVSGAGQPWKQQYDFNIELSPNSLTWTTANPLPYTVVNSHAIVTKNRIYLLGGNINDNLSDTVYSVTINKDGSLGEWTTADSLPATIINSQAIVTKNRIYLLGGIINNNRSNLVYTAPIDKNGILGKWVTSNLLPGAVSSSQAIVTKNRIYLLGGTVDSGGSDTVYTAPINEDGIIGEWAVTNPLPKTIEFSQIVVVKNKVYMLGGFIDDDHSNTVYIADLPGGLNDYSEFY